MLCLSGFELYSRWVPLSVNMNDLNNLFLQVSPQQWNCPVFALGVLESPYVRVAVSLNFSILFVANDQD